MEDLNSFLTKYGSLLDDIDTSEMDTEMRRAIVLSVVEQAKAIDRAETDQPDIDNDFPATATTTAVPSSVGLPRPSATPRSTPPTAATGLRAASSSTSKPVAAPRSSSPAPSWTRPSREDDEDEQFRQAMEASKASAGTLLWVSTLQLDF